MTEEQTISWIFLSIALSSETESADLREISSIADGINHSVPNQKELKNSISWLLNKILILKLDKKYKLTDLGKAEYEKAAKNTNTLFEIWENLELTIQNINRNN